MLESTVLFADVAGSTDLYRELGEDDGRRALTTCLDEMRDVVSRSGGRVVERIGDELLCLYPDPSSAAAAAGFLHFRMLVAESEKLLPRPMRLRVGFVHGVLEETERGVFGSTVHAAARVRSLAKAGQTLTTKETFEKLAPRYREHSRFFDSQVLKGQDGEQQIYELVWDMVATRTLQLVPPQRRTMAPGARIELRHAGKRYHVDPQTPRLEIGRDASCGLSVEGQSVSHLHARIVWNRGRAWLEDVSTNGTVVHPAAAPILRVHHETVPLAGTGLLWLGAESEGTGGALVRYACGNSSS